MSNPFPSDKTFAPVATFNWPAAVTNELPFEATLDPNGAAVVSFPVPDKVGAKLRINVSYIGSNRYPTYAMNASAKALDFDGATTGYTVAAGDYIVVAADDPDAGSHAPISRPGPKRTFRPLVAGTQMKFNVAMLDAKVASETRIQCTRS